MLVASAVALVPLAGVSPAGDESPSLSLKLKTRKVQRAHFQPLIIERGVVQSANNQEIVCRVKARSPQSQSSTTIRWVIDDGAQVKKGDLLIELDDSGLLEQLKDQKIVVDKAQFDRLQADQAYRIAQSQNETDLNAAKLNVQLAESDLEKYLKGDLRQAEEDLKDRLHLAGSEIEELKDTLAEAESKRQQNRLDDRQVRTIRRRLEAAQMALRKVQLEQKVFEKYTRPRTEMDYRGKLASAQQTLEQIKQQLKARDAMAHQDRGAKKSLSEQAMARYREIEEEIKYCKLYAPQDGRAYHQIPELFFTDRHKVAPGEAVHEGQKLLFIPDLTKMEAEIRIAESLATQVRTGTPVAIRVDALPERTLHGHISQVAAVPFQPDWFTEEKAYATKIRIEGDVSGLRPRMTALVSFPLGKELTSVLTVPARATIGKGGVGKAVSCLVLSGNTLEEREVVMGLSDEQVVEIRSGLHADEEVMVNPQLLLNDLRDRIRFVRGR